MTSADRDIQDLTDQLGLTFYKQDWGICNADARRVAEFIRICRTRKLTRTQQYEMGELVLASMNEALLDRIEDEGLVSEFQDFLTRDLDGLPEEIRYWASLSDVEEFPLSLLLGKVASIP